MLARGEAHFTLIRMGDRYNQVQQAEVNLGNANHRNEMQQCIDLLSLRFQELRMEHENIQRHLDRMNDRWIHLTRLSHQERLVVITLTAAIFIAMISQNFRWEISLSSALAIPCTYLAYLNLIPKPDVEIETIRELERVHLEYLTKAPQIQAALENARRNLPLELGWWQRFFGGNNRQLIDNGDNNQPAPNGR